MKMSFAMKSIWITSGSIFKLIRRDGEKINIMHRKIKVEFTHDQPHL